MKNIHVIPTDKPSRLRIGDNGNFVFGMIQTSIQSKNDNFTNQHIYITSDEEIRDCWAFNTHINQAYFMKGFYGKQPKAKKIILTTDQDLIKDGVQAIDDEFLEWFVKNPSHESVEIQCRYNFYAGQDLTHYKIIIPQEEPKPIHEQIIDIVGGEDRFKELVGLNSKQETLEESAEKWYDSTEENKGFSKIKAFKDGAKWQAERMYSEEDMRKAILTSFLLGVDRGNYSKELEDKLIEQFKKK